MTIVLKQNKSERNRIDKEFTTTSVTLTGDLRESTDIIRPTIYVTSSTDISVYNYAEITDFHRKYFINDIVGVAENLYKLTMECDVLSTYSAGIKTCTGLVEKNESIDASNLYISDGTFFTENRRKITTHRFVKNGVFFEFPTTQFSYVLALTGKSGVTPVERTE